MIENLRKFATENRLTQTELAKRMGISQEHMNRVMNGKAPISDAFYGRFVRAFGPGVAAAILSEGPFAHVSEEEYQ
jgi:transcriptional regulator with XRE-family HTH domain